MNFVKSSVLAVVFVSLMAAIPAAQAACSNASINGVYGVLGTGLNGSSQPASGVTRVSLDGAGNATGTTTKSIDGSIVTYTFTGTYTINANCAGSATWTNQSDQTEHDNIFLNNGNAGAYLIQTDPVHVESATAVALGTSIVCSDTGVKRRYSVQLTGSDISIGQVALAGQLTFNGTGTVSGNATLSLNGTILNSLPVSGTYVINSDCTGTAQITPKGQPAINLYLLAVSNDKEILAVETDANTIVAGTLQQ